MTRDDILKALPWAERVDVDADLRGCTIYLEGENLTFDKMQGVSVLLHTTSINVCAVSHTGCPTCGYGSEAEVTLEVNRIPAGVIG